MIKGFVVDKIKKALDEWLLGFDSDQDFNINIFSSEKVNLKNAIINSERVNKMLKEDLNLPFRLKAGMLGKLSVKISLFSLFSESVKIEVNGIHLILGSSRDSMSHPKEFHSNPKNCAYDCHDQFANIAMMHEIVARLTKSDEEKRKQEKRKKKEERKEKRAKMREEL